jgi:hypothetical protein
MLRKAPAAARRGKAATGTERGAAAPASGTVYTALQSTDFRPYGETDVTTMARLTAESKSKRRG